MKRLVESTEDTADSGWVVYDWVVWESRTADYPGLLYRDAVSSR